MGHSAFRSGNGRDERGALGPLGFSLENYDSSCAYRDTDNGGSANAANTLASLRFKNVIELIDKIVDTDDTHRCYVRRWAT